MAKASFKNYAKPTPVFFRKLGDSVLIFGTTLTANFAGMEIQKEWIITAAILTAMGKMITNLFAEEHPEPKTDNTDEQQN